MKDIELWHGDCLELMREIPDGSVDMVFADLPYAHDNNGRTHKCTDNRWDIPVPLTPLWEQILKAAKHRANFIFTATQPFASELIQSNRRMFKYDIVWIKNHHSSPFTAKFQPLRQHEHILVFNRGKSVYNPQMTLGTPYCRTGVMDKMSSNYRGDNRQLKTPVNLKIESTGERYPLSFLRVNSENRSGRTHPSQKPVALLEWLIKTYSNEGDLILDPTAGGMTTALAARNTGRRAICIEKDAEYYSKGVERLKVAA